MRGVEYYPSNNEIRFELPFAFFLANDEEDFDDLRDWILEKLGIENVEHVWHIIGHQRKHYGEDGDNMINDFFKEYYDMPGNYGVYDEDDPPEEVLLFRIWYQSKKGEKWR